MRGKETEYYQQLYTTYSSRHQKVRKRLNILSLLRLITFVAGVYFSYQLIALHLLTGLLFTVVVLGAFIYLVWLFAKNKRHLTLLSNLIRVNANEIEALRGHVGSFDAGSVFQDPSHEYAMDLELFGQGSLYQHVNRTSTYAGKNQLANWLMNPLNEKGAIELRQEAIHELKDMVEWRQLFTATGYHIQPEHYRDTQLIAWSKESSSIARQPLFKLGRWVLPLLTLAMLGLFLFGLLPVGYFLLVLAVNLVILRRASRQISSQHRGVTRQIPTLRNYGRLFHQVEKQTFQSQNLQQLQNIFFSDHQPASKSIRKLSRISDALDNRYNMIVGTLLNVLFLWDLHQVARLEGWHHRHAGEVEKWLEALGCFDAYLSLANFASNNQEFSFPRVTPNVILRGTEVGHPLINRDKRVANNLSIEKQGTALIITGANMAGKSTFLRTIGVNLVLAMTGAPVCAGEMDFQITRLFTSMNITDSLSRNESYFYAEIKRLKQLTDLAASRQNMLVLLDEILTGTNTRDKEKASKAFVERLLQMNITSIIATHDLSLTSLAGDHPELIRNASFEVELEEGRMKYDYKLRDGVAQNMNALALLRDMGLI